MQENSQELVSGRHGSVFQADCTACVRVQKRKKIPNSLICWELGIRGKSTDRRMEEAEDTEEISGQIILDERVWPQYMGNRKTEEF